MSQGTIFIIGGGGKTAPGQCAAQGARHRAVVSLVLLKEAEDHRRSRAKARKHKRAN